AVAARKVTRRWSNSRPRRPSSQRSAMISTTSWPTLWISGWSTPQPCGMTTATSSRHSARAASPESARPSEPPLIEGSAKHDRIALHGDVLDRKRLLRRAIGHRAIEVELAAVAWAVDGAVGHLIHRAPLVSALRGKPLEHAGCGLRHHIHHHDHTRTSRDHSM